jgi:magnesium chelatase family protein
VIGYRKRISGPLPVRIHIHAEVPHVDYEKLSSDSLGEEFGLEPGTGASNDEPVGLVNSRYHRVLKLARTIADLAGSDQILPVPLAEALQYMQKLVIG